MSFYCPICQNAGLPDYRRIHSICPQCNSDLKPFLLLDSISTYPKSRKSIFVIVGLFLFLLLSVVLVINTINAKQKLVKENAILSEDINHLLSQFTSKPTPETNNQANVNNEVIIKYTVRKDDYPYKIAEFFYGDGNKYKQIEKENNLVQPYVLRVGQILNIVISPE